MSAGRQYATDVTDEPWDLLPCLLPERTWSPGRPPCERRRMVNGIVSVNKTGCQWRMLPKAFGHWHTVYGYCRRWRQAGVWAQMMTELRQDARRCQGRLPEPSACCADSQSVKTATQDEDVGFDGNKKIPGRKRYILVDTLGLIVVVVVTAANVDDRQGLVTLLRGYCAEKVTRLRKVWVDSGYRTKWLCAWVWGVKRTHKIALEVVEHTGKGCTVVSHRWVVERTFAWLLNYRRHQCDYEGLTSRSEAMIQISMIRLLLKRLA